MNIIPNNNFNNKEGVNDLTTTKEYSKHCKEGVNDLTTAEECSKHRKEGG